MLCPLEMRVRGVKHLLLKVLIFCGACLACWVLYPSLSSASSAPSSVASRIRQAVLLMKSAETPAAAATATERVQESVGSFFRGEFFLPQPRVVKGPEELERSPWMRSLHTYLRSLNDTTTTRHQIYLLTSNYKYLDVLLNWLISAVVRCNIPMQSILTLSLDYPTHTVLRTRGFSSVLVLQDDLFADQDSDLSFSSPFERVMMLRLSLMRIVNHFGFDVVMVDTDSIMLKDPQPLFDTLKGEDIVGSVGTIPNDLFAEWAVTICIGVVLVRSSERTGESRWCMEEISFYCCCYILQSSIGME